MSFGDDTLDPSNFWDGKERRKVPAGYFAVRDNSALTQEWSREVFDAAVRRAAENAALSIADMIDCRHDSSYVTDFITTIERHVRQELGL